GAALHRTRSAAVERFAALGFPTPDDEEWRFTPLAPLTRTTFRLEDSPPPVTAEQLDRVAPSTGDSSRLVFVNGRFAPALSSLRQLPPGAVVRSLADALSSHRELVEEHLARHADFEGAAFTALNTAFVRDGAFVHLPAGKVVEDPIHLVFVGTAPG